MNENKDKAKQGLVALELVFTRKIAQAQNFICWKHLTSFKSI